MVMLTSAMLFFASPAVAQDHDLGNSETLLLNVIINTQLLPDVVRAERLADGRLALGLAAWESAHLHLPEGKPLLLPDNQMGFALESVTDLTYTLDYGEMTLVVMAPASAFTSSHVNQVGMAVVLPDSVRPGFYLDYDSTLSSGDDSYESYGVVVEGTAFSRWGSAVSGLLVTGNHQHDQVIRTQSYWQKDLPDSMETLVFGDTVGDGGSWSRPARYAGIRWARNFSLRPGFIAMPMPSLSGTAALPSTVDVLINNQRRTSEQVNPGPFELTNVPVLSGAGDINLIVRDLLGRENIINQRYYFSPQMLAKGLSDFSVETGFLRENYGRESNDYDVTNGFIAATGRYGMTSGLTGEVHIETQEKRQAVGVNFVSLLGTFATAEVAVASSCSDHVKGNHYLFGLERRTSRGYGALRWGYFDRDFVQFAAVPNELRPRERLSIGLGALLQGDVSTTINYTAQTSWEEERVDLLSINLGVTLPEGIYLSSYLSQDLGAEKGWSAGITFNLPLGRQRTASTSSSFNRKRNAINRAELSQSEPGGPGSGWRLVISDDRNQRWRAGLSHNTPIGSIKVEATDTVNNAAFRLGARGSVGWLGGHAFAARTIGAGSFAVVNVGNIEDVSVYRRNQLIAVTNGNGMALVPDLIPYQANQLTINPITLPFDVEILSIKEITVPFARSGLFVDFPVNRSRNALVLLRQHDGAVVPAGARVTVSSDENGFLVGKRGETYLMNLSDSNHLSVQWKDGACELMLELDPDGPSEPRLGPLTCVDRL